MRVLTVLSGLLWSSSVLAQIPLDQGLLLHYKFDGNVQDASGNNYHGGGSVFYGSDYMGNNNAALSLSDIDQHLLFPQSSELQPQLPVTVAFRVWFNSLDPAQSWVFSTNYTENQYFGVIGNTNGDGRFNVSIGDGDPNVTSGSSRRTKTSTSYLFTGVWYHIVCVVRGATDMDIYIDCVNDGGTYSGTGGAMAYNGDPGSIGIGDVSGFSPYFLNGKIDDFRYWNRELTAVDVDKLCELIAGVSPSEPEVRFAVYPNPTSNQCTLELPQTAASFVIQVSDLQGRVVWETQTQSPTLTIPMAHLESGLYSVCAKSEQNVWVRKVSKQ